MQFAASEFKDNIVCTGADGIDLPRTTSWTGIKYMLAEVKVSSVYSFRFGLKIK